ncbi:hypothetical protein BDR26DRAFT_859960 [Obelidium mucronatum]|nr:hypothetical protein BDR26DRAFT_859960 [Obelidium mucronatum]
MDDRLAAASQRAAELLARARMNANSTGAKLENSNLETFNFNNNNSMWSDLNTSLLSAQLEPPLPHEYPQLVLDAELLQPPILTSTISRFRNNLMTRNLFPASIRHPEYLDADSIDSPEREPVPEEENAPPEPFQQPESPQIQTGRKPISMNSMRDPLSLGHHQDSSTAVQKTTDTFEQRQQPQQQQQRLRKDSGTSPIVNTSILQNTLSAPPSLSNRGSKKGAHAGVAKSVDGALDKQKSYQELPETQNDSEKETSNILPIPPPLPAPMPMSATTAPPQPPPQLAAHVESLKLQMESLEEVQDRMHQLNKKFLEHQSVLVGQQRDAVYDHALRQMENFQDIQQKQSFWQADHLKKLRELHSEELDHQTLIETKVKRIKSTRESSMKSRQRNYEESEDTRSFLQEEKTAEEPRRQTRKVRLLQISPKRAPPSVTLASADSANEEYSKREENDLFRELKEQLSSVQRDLQTIAQKSAVSTAPPSPTKTTLEPHLPVTPPTRDYEEEVSPPKQKISTEVQEAIDNTIQQFLNVRDKILNTKYDSIKPADNDYGRELQQPPPVSSFFDTSTINTSTMSSTKKIPFQLRGLKPYSKPKPNDADTSYYHSLTQTMMEISKKKKGLILELEEESFVARTGASGGGIKQRRQNPYQLSASVVKELGRSSNMEDDNDDEEDEEILMERDDNGGGTFMRNLLDGDRIGQIVNLHIEKAGILATQASAIVTEKPPLDEVKTQSSSGTKLNVSASRIPVKPPKIKPVAPKEKDRKRTISPEKPAPTSRMPGVSFTRAGLAKPKAKLQKNTPLDISKAAEAQSYMAPPPHVSIPKSPERPAKKRTSPVRQFTAKQEPSPEAFEPADEFQQAIEKYHVSALASKFLHSGKVTQLPSAPAKLQPPQPPLESKQIQKPALTKWNGPQGSSRQEQHRIVQTPTIPEFYNVKVANAPVFLRRTTIRPASLQFLEGSRPDWDTSIMKDGRRSTSPVKNPAESRRHSPERKLPPKGPTATSAVTPVKQMEPGLFLSELVLTSNLRFFAVAESEKPKPPAQQHNEFVQTMPLTNDLGVQVGIGQDIDDEQMSQPTRVSIPSAVEVVPVVTTPTHPLPKETKDTQVQYQSPTKDASAQYHTPYESSADVSRIEGAELFAGLEFNRATRRENQSTLHDKHHSEAFKGHQESSYSPRLTLPKDQKTDLPIEVTEWMRNEIMARLLLRQSSKASEQLAPTSIENSVTDTAQKIDETNQISDPHPPATPLAVTRAAIRLLHQDVSSAAKILNLPRQIGIQQSFGGVTTMRGIPTQNSDVAGDTADARNMEQTESIPEPGSFEFFQLQMEKQEQHSSQAPAGVVSRGIPSSPIFHPPPPPSQASAASTTEHSPSRLAAAFGDFKSQFVTATKGVFNSAGGGAESSSTASAVVGEETATQPSERLRLEEERTHRIEMLAELRRMREAQEIRAEQERLRLVKEDEQRLQENVERIALLRDRELDLKKQQEDFEKRLVGELAERERKLEEERQSLVHHELSRIEQRKQEQRVNAEVDVMSYKSKLLSVNEPSHVVDDAVINSSEGNSVGISTLSTMISEGEILTQFYSEGEIVPNVGVNRINDLIYGTRKEDDSTSKDAISDAVEVATGFSPQTHRPKVKPLFSGKKQLHNNDRDTESGSAKSSGDSKASAGEVTSLAELSRVEILNEMSGSEEGQIGASPPKLKPQNLTTDDVTSELLQIETTPTYAVTSQPPSLQSKLSHNVAPSSEHINSDRPPEPAALRPKLESASSIVQSRSKLDSTDSIKEKFADICGQSIENLSSQHEPKRESSEIIYSSRHESHFSRASKNDGDSTSSAEYIPAKSTTAHLDTNSEAFKSPRKSDSSKESLSAKSQSLGDTTSVELRSGSAVLSESRSVQTSLRDVSATVRDLEARLNEKIRSVEHSRHELGNFNHLVERIDVNPQEEEIAETPLLPRSKVTSFADVVEKVVLEAGVFPATSTLPHNLQSLGGVVQEQQHQIDGLNSKNLFQQSSIENAVELEYQDQKRPLSRSQPRLTSNTNIDAIRSKENSRLNLASIVGKAMVLGLDDAVPQVPSRHVLNTLKDPLDNNNKSNEIRARRQSVGSHESVGSGKENRGVSSTQEEAMELLHSLSTIEHNSFSSEGVSKFSSSSKSSKSGSGSSNYDAREVLSQLSHLSESSIRKDSILSSSDESGSSLSSVKKISQSKSETSDSKNQSSASTKTTESKSSSNSSSKSSTTTTTSSENNATDTGSSTTSSKHKSSEAKENESSLSNKSESNQSESDLRSDEVSALSQSDETGTTTDTRSSKTTSSSNESHKTSTATSSRPSYLSLSTGPTSSRPSSSVAPSSTSRPSVSTTGNSSRPSVSTTTTRPSITSTSSALSQQTSGTGSSTTGSSRSLLPDPRTLIWDPRSSQTQFRTPLKGSGPRPFDEIVSPVSTVSPRTAPTLSPSQDDMSQASERKHANEDDEDNSDLHSSSSENDFFGSRQLTSSHSSG